MKTHIRSLSTLIQYSFTQPKREVMSNTDNTRLLDLTALEKENSSVQAIIIVNNILNEKWLGKGLKSCKNVVIADGGANKLYATRFKNTDSVRSVVGDFDSVKPHVREFYESKGVKFEIVEDQNTNDFQKAILKCIRSGWEKLFCFGAFGGRMDHSMSNLSSTAKLSKQYPNLDIALVGRENLMYLIRPYIKHKIRISPEVDHKGCGLIRFGHNVRIQTKGLKWDMGEGHEFWQIGWSNFVSTSNEIVGEEVEIETEGDVFFVLHVDNRVDVV